MRVPRAAFLIGLLLHGESGAARADDFGQARLQAGRAAFERQRYTEAVANLRIASFAMLDSPPRVLECLARIAIVQAAAGRPPEERKRHSTGSSRLNGDSESTEKSTSIRGLARHSRRCCAVRSPRPDPRVSPVLWAVLNGRRPAATPTTAPSPTPTEAEPRRAAECLTPTRPPVPTTPPFGPPAPTDTPRILVTRTASVAPTSRRRRRPSPFGDDRADGYADAHADVRPPDADLHADPALGDGRADAYPHAHADPNPNHSLADGRADRDSDCHSDQNADSAVGDRGADPHPDCDTHADATPVPPSATTTPVPTDTPTRTPRPLHTDVNPTLGDRSTHRHADAHADARVSHGDPRAHVDTVGPARNPNAGRLRGGGRAVGPTDSPPRRPWSPIPCTRRTT